MCLFQKWWFYVCLSIPIPIHHYLYLMYATNTNNTNIAFLQSFTKQQNARKNWIKYKMIFLLMWLAWLQIVNYELAELELPKLRLKLTGCWLANCKAKNWKHCEIECHWPLRRTLQPIAVELKKFNSMCECEWLNICYIYNIVYDI